MQVNTGLIVEKRSRCASPDYREEVLVVVQVGEESS